MTYDFIAIGLGPYNLGLACLTEPIAELNGLFLESRPDVSWHPGMMLDAARLQTPFLADLVTLADPTSPFSFLSYLKEKGRIYPFYIRESFYPLRAEYDDYCRWAAAKLNSVRFGQRVTSITHAGDLYTVHTDDAWYETRRLVLGTGTPPYLPEPCADLGGDLIHNSVYRDHRDALRSKPSITVVGSGQSAAEIFHDLLGDIDRYGYRLTWLTRSPRFFPLEYTKLTLEMTSPDYVDYFHALDEPTRYRLESAQKGLFKGINADLINDIYDLLYQKSTAGPVASHLFTDTELTGASYDETTGAYALSLRHTEQRRTFELTTHGLVLATGYRYRMPEFLEPIRDRIRLDTHGRFDVARDYTIDHGGREIFLQNAGTHTHSITSPDLGMGPYRNSWIIRELLGREYYPIEKSIAFQTFGGGGVSLTIRDLDPVADAPVLHRWLTHPKSRYWQMLQATEEQVRAAYQDIAAHPHQDAFLGLHDGEPAFLVERYDPSQVELVGLFDARDGDVGMHFLCAPTDRPVPGFTRDVITAVLTFLFADPATVRVVVEPDVRNTAVHRLNAAVGFQVLATVTKPEKQALLSVCTRARFLTAIGSRA